MIPASLQIHASQTRGSVAGLPGAVLFLLHFVFFSPFIAASDAPVQFGGSNWYPPFHYPAGSGRQAEGFDVAVLEAIADRAGFAVNYRFDDWDRIQSALADGDVDIVPMFISDERRQRYLFTDPVSVEYHQLFGTGAGRSVTKLEDVAGLRIATEKASYAGGQLQELNIRATLVEAASEAEALRMVVRGDADFALIPVSVALYAIATERMEALHSLSPPLLPVTYAFAITPGRSDLLDIINMHLADMQRDGSLRELRETWMSGKRRADTGWLTWPVLLAVILGGGLLGRYRALQRTRIGQLAVQPGYIIATEPDEESSRLLVELRQTLDEKGLSWMFQPQYSVNEQRIVGGEMLVRWEHPELGFIAPDRFIGLAERGGLIQQLTRQAMDQARLVLTEWQRLGLECTLSVNVSANDFADAETLAHIITAARGFERCIMLEITETAIMHDMPCILRAIDELKSVNIRISLDDYGTGYSSMAYLKEFNFDEIKIDRIFSCDLLKDKRNQMLMRASTRLGHELGALVVAEGVEDLDTATKLVELGCDVLQGYMIARPLSLEQFNRFIHEHVIMLPTQADRPGMNHPLRSGLANAWRERR